MYVTKMSGADLDEEQILRLILEPIIERAKEDRIQSLDDGAVHVSKLSRGCAKFEEAEVYEENMELLIQNLKKGKNNAISWLLGQLVHIAFEHVLNNKNIHDCIVTSEKEIDTEVEIECPPHKTRLKGHVDLFVDCGNTRFAIELKYRSTGEIGARSLYQTKIYSAALGVPVYIVVLAPNGIKIERIEADKDFLRKIVSEFKCKGYIEEIVFNPDARPCNNCIHRHECNIWKKAIPTLLSRLKKR